MSRARLAASCVAAVLAASAIAHATARPVRTGPTVVAVGDGPDVATGFAVAPGRVVTVAHVLAGTAPTVRGADGVAREASVVRRDRALDLALLAVPGLPAARRGDAALPAVLGLRPAPPGDPAPPAVPGPQAEPRAATTRTRVLVRRNGRIAALPARIVRPIDARVRTAGDSAAASRPALELAARVAAGDSGAPVIRDGRVAGIVFARSHDRPGVAYAVDAAVLARFVR